MKMQAHLIFKVYQREKCTQSRSFKSINFFLIIRLRLSRAVQKFVAGRSLPTPVIENSRYQNLSLFSSFHHQMEKPKECTIFAHFRVIDFAS